MIVGNSEESRETAGGFAASGFAAAGFAVSVSRGLDVFNVGLTDAPILCNTREGALGSGIVDVGGDHTFGFCPAGAAGAVELEADGGARSTAGSAAETFCNNRCRRSTSNFAYIFESFTMCASIGDAYDVSSSVREDVKKL